MDILGDYIGEDDDTNEEEDIIKNHIGYYNTKLNIRFWVSEEYVNGRSGHVSLPYKDQVIVWGGMDRKRYKFLPAEEVLLYSPQSCSWTCHMTGGDIPPGRSGAVAEVICDRNL